MSTLAISAGKFFSAWLPALAISASVDPAPRLADAFMWQLGGIGVPPITSLLGFAGVIMARPLARKREKSGWPTFALVTAIMMIVVQLWIVESRPGALFAFVIAIGLGFSGYSLIELVGSEINNFIKRIVAIPTGSLRDTPPADPKKEDTNP